MKSGFRGIAAIIAAVACYGLFGTLAKFMGQSFGSFSQNWIRNLLVIVIIVTYARLSGVRWKKIAPQDWRWMLAWTLSGSANTILLYIAFNHIPIGTAYFLLYSGMIMTGFISGSILFHERITTRKIIALLLSVLGLVIIYYWDIRSFGFLYPAFAVTAGIMVGLWNTLSKKVSDKYPNHQLVFTDAFMSFLVGLVGWIVLREHIPTVSFTAPWIAVVVWAVAQVAATAFVVYGFKKLEAQVASVIMPIEVIFGTIFGYIFFAQVLPLTTLLGGLLIASAAVVAGSHSD